MNAGVLARIGAPVVPGRKGSPEIVSPFFSAGLKNVKASACLAEHVQRERLGVLDERVAEVGLDSDHRQRRFERGLGDQLTMPARCGWCAAVRT
jgi:hypothetical protein